LRLILYDRTCRGRAGLGLSSAWRGGTHLYRALGRCDGSFGASSWEEGLAWLGTYRGDRPIDEVQYWGHGKWGRLYLDREVLDRSAFARQHVHHQGLAMLRERLSPEALVWFRTCETLGATNGQAFAEACTAFFGCAVAGHTFIIGYWQSGLHRLQPGQVPHWSASEGLIEGSPDAPRRAGWSRPGQPRTISCLAGQVPPGW